PLGRCTQSGTSGLALAPIDVHEGSQSNAASAGSAEGLLSWRSWRRNDTLFLQLLQHLLHGVVPERWLGDLDVLLHGVDDPGELRAALAQKIGTLRQATDAGRLGRAERLEQLGQGRLGGGQISLRL